ncbi:MAG: hypothetical protein ACRDG8_07200 [Actinomycetota bacterium]
MNDVRDEALGAVLDREATRIESAPVDRLPEVLRRGSRMRAIRFTAIAAAVGVFVGAVSWAGLQNEGRGTIPANIANWDTFASLEQNGWTVQVPPSWQVLELPACRGAPKRIGVMVTNVEFEFRDPRGGPPGCSDRLVFAGFPVGGVAFTFMPIVGDSIPGFPFELPDTTLPLTPDLLVRSNGIRGGPSESFQSIWLKKDWIGTVRRFEGPEAIPADVAALDQMLGSFGVRGAPQWIEAAASTPSLRASTTHPEGWEVTRFRGVTVIDAPQPILMVTTPGVKEGYSFCLGGPFGEFTSLGRFGVVVAVSDATGSWLGNPELGPRPPSLRPSTARFDDIVTCSGEVRRLWFQFEEAGRPIVVNVLVTKSYLREQPQLLLHILNSIRIEEA